MTVTNVHKDTDALTLTITAEFDAPVERVWKIWEDPRQLERWWGPPTYPATVVDARLHTRWDGHLLHDRSRGGRHGGWWRMTAVESPHHLEFEDGFADDTGTPNPEMPTTIVRVDLVAADGGGTSMAIVSTFPSVEAMEQMSAMGMVEGMKAAMGQIDELLRVVTP